MTGSGADQADRYEQSEMKCQSPLAAFAGAGGESSAIPLRRMPLITSEAISPRQNLQLIGFSVLMIALRRRQCRLSPATTDDRAEIRTSQTRKLENNV
jgi:hypothetical protein